MEYRDPQLMHNFPAIAVTVIHLFSWNRALVHSMLAAVHEVVIRPEWALSTMLFFHF
jgi:hypothetical protein